MKKAPPVEQKGGKNANGENGGTEAPDAGQAPRERKLSPVLVFGVVFLLLAAVASALIFLHPTARARAEALAAAVLRRSPPGGQDENRPSPGEGEALAAERAALAAERAQLEALKSSLAAHEAGLLRREETLAAGERSLQEQTAKQAALMADVNRMVRICQQMRPRDAAELMEKLDDQQALAILLRLAETSAAQILGAMSRDRAANLIKLMVPGSTG